MPFGDKTGPLGQGPMTGRGRGYCAGNATPGSLNPARGAGLGRGGRGGGGLRNRFRAQGFNAEVTPTAGPLAPANQQQEVATLKGAIDELLGNLNSIRERVEELEARPKHE